MLTNPIMPQAKRKKGISLTALIDVVFILLMFFMLTSTFVKKQSIVVNTPSLSQDGSDESTQLLVIHENGTQTFIHDSHTAIIDWEQLATLVDPQQPVILLPEKNITFARIVQAMEAVKQAGVTTFTLGQPVRSSQETASLKSL